LDKRAWQYTGLCPIHKETNSSFTIYPLPNTFYCFGCKEGGDVFNFIIEKEQVSFSSALKILAKKVDISLDCSIDHIFIEKQREIIELYNLASLFLINSRDSDLE
jgi:DNA primase